MIAVFKYKCDEFYYPEVGDGINILDDTLEIDWIISIENAILSEKTKHLRLEDFESSFFVLTKNRTT